MCDISPRFMRVSVPWPRTTTCLESLSWPEFPQHPVVSLRLRWHSISMPMEFWMYLLSTRALERRTRSPSPMTRVCRNLMSIIAGNVHIECWSGHQTASLIFFTEQITFMSSKDSWLILADFLLNVNDESYQPVLLMKQNDSTSTALWTFKLNWPFITRLWSPVYVKCYVAICKTVLTVVLQSW